MRLKTCLSSCAVVLSIACELEEATPRALHEPSAGMLAEAVVRVARADEGSLVMAVPAAAALERLSRALVEEPGLGLDPLAYQRFVAPSPYRLDGAWRPVKARSVVLRGEDPVLGDRFVVDLLAVEGPGGTRHVLHPMAGVATPTPSPVDPDVLVIERELALFVVDVVSGQVRALGDAGARGAALAAAAEVPLVDEGPPLVWATAPQWSPDGGQIAFLTTRGGEPTVPELWVHGLDRGDERRISAPGVQIRLLGWHGDDAVLVEDLDDPARPRLAAIGVDGGGLRPLADGAVIGRSPGGDAVALAFGPPERLRVDLFDLSSGTAEKIAELDDGEVLRSWQADFSDDGSRVVLDLSDAAGRQALLVAERGGEASRLPLPGRGQLAAPPTWLGERLLVSLEDLASGTATTHLVTPL